MDRLRDFLHDNTDIFIALLIAFAMFAVVAANLGSWFNVGSGVVAADSNQEGASSELNEAAGDSEEEKDTSGKTVAEDVKNNEPANKNQVQDTPKPQAPPAAPPATPPAAVIVELKTIVIPSGTPGIGIARILQEEGLISSTSDFTKAAADLKLEGRLRSGTFQIPANASVEEMVKIISGQR